MLIGEVRFKKKERIIEMHGKQLLLAKRLSNVYVLDSIKRTEGYICLASISEDPWVCHKKLGHTYIRQIEKLTKHEFVNGLQ